MRNYEPGWYLDSGLFLTAEPLIIGQVVRDTLRAHKYIKRNFSNPFSLYIYIPFTEKQNPKLPKETLTDINPGWTDNTWERRSKVLTNWLIYAQLLRPTRDRVTGNLARLF